MSDLSALFGQWRSLKELEENSKEARVGIEAAIVDIVKPVFGTNRVPEVPGMKIVVSETKTWDQDILKEIAATIESNFPFGLVTTYKENTKGVAWIKTNAPDTWKKILPALTIKPAKPAFSFEEKKSEEAA